MPVFKFSLTILAQQDILRIYKYGVENFGFGQAEKYYLSLYECFERISERPYSFKSIGHLKSGFRKCVSGADTIYFLVEEDDSVLNTAILGKQDLMKRI